MEPPEALEKEVAVRARRAGLLSPGDTVLVAVSGGRDSAATAALLCAAGAHDLPLDVVLGHVDHGWRGPAEAKADLAVVRRLARLLGVRLLRAGPPKPVRKTEDAARRHRYTALERLATKAGAFRIVTGHHLRDQAETYVMRLRRGSGPAGLAGIPARRPLANPLFEVVRPVLWVEPSRLAAYAEAKKLPWREDPTNAALDRDRAKVRAELTALGARAASEARVLAEAADGFARALSQREADVRARLSKSLFADVEAWYVEVAAKDFAGLGEAEYATGLRVLGAQIHAGRGGPWFTRRHATLVGALARHAATSGSIDLPHGIVGARHGARLALFRITPTTAPSIEIPRGGHVLRPYEWATVDVRWEDVPRETFDLAAWRDARRSDGRGPPHRAALDADRLGPRATLRPVSDLDLVFPLGAKEASLAIAFAAKNGVARERSVGLRVLEADDGGVAWVVGVRVDRRYAITDATTRIALFEVDVRPR